MDGMEVRASASSSLPHGIKTPTLTVAVGGAGVPRQGRERSACPHAWVRQQVGGRLSIHDEARIRGYKGSIIMCTKSRYSGALPDLFTPRDQTAHNILQPLLDIPRTTLQTPFPSHFHHELSRPMTRLPNRFGM